jgi:hypothetical protein
MVDGPLAQFLGAMPTAEMVGSALQSDFMIAGLNLLSPEKCCLLDPCRRV